MTSHNIAALEVIQQCLISAQAWEETALKARQPDTEAPCRKSSWRIIKVTLSIPLQRRKCLKGKAATAWLHPPLTQSAVTRAGYNRSRCSQSWVRVKYWVIRQILTLREGQQNHFPLQKQLLLGCVTPSMSLWQRYTTPMGFNFHFPPTENPTLGRASYF